MHAVLIAPSGAPHVPRRVKIFELAFPRGLRLDHRLRFGLSSARPSPILSVTRDGKGEGETMDWNTYWRISRGLSIRNCSCAMSTSSPKIASCATRSRAECG